MSEYRPSNRKPNPTTLLRKIKTHLPDSGQLLGILTLFILASIFITLIGLTVTAAILGFIFFMPLILVSSPVWFPLGTVLFVSIAWFLSACSFGAVIMAGLSWTYRYFNAAPPVKPDKIDHKRSRMYYDMASSKEDYAMEYGVKMIA